MYQSITAVGNLGRDPEMRHTPAGTPVTNFNLAANRQYTDKDDKKVKETTWFRVSVFGKAAEACAQYLHKGSAVLVEGTLVPDPQTGGPRVYQRQDGSSGASFEVRAKTVRFLSKAEAGAAETAPEAAAEDSSVPTTDEELGF